ncbi:MAG: hypothetical protein H6873_09940 [Hyphomicrobiaceae bacterium]|nr:hypothetical protein [Hyphomicrobiaceae bacterium]
MTNLLSDTFDQSDPPSGISRPLQALWWLKKGKLKVGPEWEKAHLICQYEEGNPMVDVVHALAHWIEADMGNSDYWYRRAGTRRSRPSVSEEWEHLAEVFSNPNG